MTADQKRRVHRLLESALGLSESARSDYLEQACADDTTLRDLVQTMLDGRGPVEGFLGDDHSPRGFGPVFSAGDLVAGRFRIVRFHGRGGMGEVYEAFDERLRVRLALKTLRPDALGGDALERFRREILIAREVSHPNLCRAYDLVEHSTSTELPPVACLTMEWLEGETLQAFLHRRRPMATDAALPVVSQIAAALDALHGAGIVHRDLKPGNVMLTSTRGELRAVVMDFGLAKAASSDGEWFESSTDAQAGAPYFMAPEQMRGGRPTPASDIYSLGLLIDEMVIARRAFEGSSLGSVIYQRISAEPSPPADRAGALPASWNSTILRCLEKDPSNRFQSASAVVAALSGTVPPQRPKAGGSRLWMLGVGLPAALAIAAALSSAPLTRTSLIVFPLNDLSGDESFRHLPTGIGAELVSRLSRVNGLSVRRFYQPRDKAPLRVLEGRYHLDGDVQKHADRVRLNLRITDAGTDAVVWSDALDARLEDPLALQDRAARAVLDGVEEQLAENAGLVARARMIGSRTTGSLLAAFSPPSHVTADPQAYRDYLRARQLMDDRSPDAIGNSVQLLRRAVDRDPSYAPAWALLGDAIRAVIDSKQGPAELVADSRRAAEQAIRLDPGLAEGHLSLAGVEQMEWDWAAAEASYRRALAADPKLAATYHRYGGLVIQFGRFDEALAMIRQGLDLDPYDYPAQSAYGLCLTMARRYDDAIAHLEHLVTQRDFVTAHANLVSAYANRARASTASARERDLARALEEVEAVRNFESRGSSGGSTPMSDYWFALIHAERGDMNSSSQALSRLVAASIRPNPVSLALVYGARNEKEAAVRYLRQAADEKDRGLLYLKVHPLWDPIRDTDGYREVLARMRL